MCGRKSALLLLSLSLASPLWSQSFDPDETYQVKGAQLNKLSQDLQTAKSELETLRTKNEQLEKDSESKGKALTALQERLTMVSQSFQTSQNEALVRDTWIGAGGVALGIVAVLVYDGLTARK